MFNQKNLTFYFLRRIPSFVVAIIFSISLVCLTGCDSSDDDDNPPADNNPPVEAQELASGIQGGAGSAIGPDGALYVTESGVGKVTRIDPSSGAKTTFAEGLPPMIAGVGIGGAYDIAFLNDTAYVIVTLVGSDVGGSDAVGLYRIDGVNDHTVVANIGDYNIANPPSTAFDVPSGVQFAIQTYNGGFIITDGHLNRVLFVTPDGSISVLHAFGNVVPTGLELDGNTVYMTELGPGPNNPEDGKLMTFNGTSPGDVTMVTSGVRMMIDVEYSSDHRLFALSQGTWDGAAAGSPANPDTGSLVEINNDGSITVIVDEIDRPTSLEFKGNTAYIVTIPGEVLTVDTE